MGQLFSKPFSWRRPFCRLFLPGIIFLGCSLTLLADTPALLRRVPAGGCYSHCGESHPRASCVKVCVFRREAATWWVNHISKTPSHTPSPHFNPRPHSPPTR